jgi:hypothetical protein
MKTDPDPKPNRPLSLNEKTNPDPKPKVRIQNEKLIES